MQLHLVITPEIRKTMPDTVKTVYDFGKITVRFENSPMIGGENRIIEDTEENIKKWLRPFKGVCVGVGSPCLENFEIVHIKD